MDSLGCKPYKNSDITGGICLHYFPLQTHVVLNRDCIFILSFPPRNSGWYTRFSPFHPHQNIVRYVRTWLMDLGPRAPCELHGHRGMSKIHPRTMLRDALFQERWDYFSPDRKKILPGPAQDLLPPDIPQVWKGKGYGASCSSPPLSFPLHSSFFILRSGWWGCWRQVCGQMEAELAPSAIWTTPGGVVLGVLSVLDWPLQPVLGM